MRTLALALAFVASLAGCDARDRPVPYQGHIEGEYVYVAPLEMARVVEVLVRRGQSVNQGDLLFRMETTDVAAEHAEATAKLAQAEAQLADLEKSQKRPPEIAAIRAQIEQASATFTQTDRDLKRKSELALRDFASKLALDEARAARDRAGAQVTELQSQLEAGGLSARPDDIAAATRNVEAARAALARAAWRLNQRTIAAPEAGYIEDTLRRVGEMASPTQPVVSLLPPTNRKIRFYVPEAERARIHIGQRIAVACDQCPAGLQGEVSYIASDAEFTPPVIFSVESRQKLVYLVEARPLDAAVALNPGQPVDVTPLTEAQS